MYPQLSQIRNEDLALRIKFQRRYSNQVNNNEPLKEFNIPPPPPKKNCHSVKD
jgi:hypothetical protein